MSIFRKLNDQEDHSGNNETGLSIDDSRQKEVYKELKALADDEQLKQEHAKLVEESYEELTDTTEPLIYLRAAQKILQECEMENNYKAVIKIAIAYARIGQPVEALKLIEALDLPFEQYDQKILWHQSYQNRNPFSAKFAQEDRKRRSSHKYQKRWKFKGYEHYIVQDEHRYGWSSSESAAIQKSLMYLPASEKKFIEEFGLNPYHFIDASLAGLSPRDYVLAMIAYYSNWLVGISTEENVQKFAATLEDPTKDFELPYDKAYYGVVKKQYQKDGPKVIGEKLKSIKTNQANAKETSQRDKQLSGLEEPNMLIALIADIAVAKYKGEEI